MSRSPSPASSLDFVDSDPSGSEDEYAPVKRRAPAKAPARGGAAAATGIKINLTALQRAREVASSHPADGAVDYDDGGDDGGGFLEGLVGRRGIDLSDENLKADHAARPLWIDESGNM